MAADEPCKMCGEIHDNKGPGEAIHEAIGDAMADLAERLGESPEAWRGAGDVMAMVGYYEALTDQMADDDSGDEGAIQAVATFFAVFHALHDHFLHNPAGNVAYTKALDAMMKQHLAKGT